MEYDMEHNSDTSYDLIIIGGGPAGFSAALYAVRYQLRTLIIGQMPGGTAAEAHKICNFPTEVEISGGEIAQKMYTAATHHGAEMVFDTVDSIEQTREGNVTVHTDGGATYTGRTLLVAVGTQRRTLDVPGEEHLFGRGVSYCATCDGMFYKDRTVAVVGGSDAALTAALYLADVAEHVHLVYRGDALRGDQVWAEQVSNNKNITVHYNTHATRIDGDDAVESMAVTKGDDERSENISVGGVFIEIGAVPNTELFTPMGVETDAKGYIHVGEDQRTNIDGVWAAGDITDGSNGFRQIITAAAEGAIAAQDISTYIQKNA